MHFYFSIYFGYSQHIGLASVELNERLFSVTEFDDDDFCTEFEAVVVLLGPKECIVPNIEGEVSFVALIEVSLYVARLTAFIPGAQSTAISV